MTRQATITGVLSRLNVLGLVGAAAAGIYAALTADWLAVVAAAIVIVGASTNLRFAVLGLLAAGLLQAWIVIAPAALVVAVRGGMHGYARLQFRIPRALDEIALAGAVAELPAALRQLLQSTASDRVDTGVILRAAIADDPQRWSSFARSPVSIPDNSEGGDVLGTRWSLVAAEAALVAGQHPDRTFDPDVHTLAAIALALPHSRIQVALGERREAFTEALAAAGLRASQLVKMMGQGAARPGGELMIRRVEWYDQPKASQLLDEDRWRALGAPISRGNERRG